MMKITYPGFKSFNIDQLKKGKYVKVEVNNNEFLANPGEYIIKKEN